MADEYIKRTLAKAEFTGNFRDEYPTALIHALIDSVPAADVAPIRHGRWVMNDQSTPVCSRCGNVVAFVSHPDRKWDFGNYCPNCGADMREVQSVD